MISLHPGGDDISYEQQGHIGEMILERVRSLEAAGMVCIVGEILPRVAYRGNIDAVGFERGGRQFSQFLRRRLWDCFIYFSG